jgi:hypothetical protein
MHPEGCQNSPRLPEYLQKVSTVAELAAQLYAPKENNIFGESLAKYYGPELTQEIIDNAEQELGLKLPESLVELLRYQNGGFTRLDFFEIDGHEGSFRCVNGLGYEHGIDRMSAYMIEEWGYPNPAIWLEGDGHMAVLLDYRDLLPGAEPPVILVDVETVSGTPEATPLAINFKSFLEKLARQAESLAHE